MSQIDPQTLLLAILEVGANSQPNPDGTLTKQTEALMRRMAADLGGQQPQAPMALEHYGTEHPGPGRRYAGDGKWVRDA